MMKIGSHVGMSGKDMFLNSVKEAVGYGVYRSSSKYTPQRNQGLKY